MKQSEKRQLYMRLNGMGCCYERATVRYVARGWYRDGVYLGANAEDVAAKLEEEGNRRRK